MFVLNLLTFEENCLNKAVVSVPLPDLRASIADDKKEPAVVS